MILWFTDVLAGRQCTLVRLSNKTTQTTSQKIHFLENTVAHV